MNKYPKYKNSSVAWLGDIPESWEIIKLIGICGFVRGNSSFKKDELLNSGEYVALQYGKTYKVDEVDEKFEFYVNDEFYKASQVVNYGDVIIISTSETIEDLGHSVFYSRNAIGLLGGEQILLKPNNEKVNEKYLYYSAKVFTKELQKYATGVKVFRFNINDLKTIYTSIPLKPEQTAIVNFLDYKLEKIDRFISKKRQLIKLLNEQKAAIINQTVTKGLNPNAKMKPSGIEWLGDIPEHWIMDKLSRLLKPNGLIRGPFGSALKTSSFVKKGYKVYEQKNAIYKNLEIGNSYIDEEKYNGLKRFEIQQYDFLMSCSGTIGELHQVNEVFEKGIINQAMMIMRIQDKIIPDFFIWLFRSQYIKTTILDSSKGSAMKNLVGINEFKAVKIPVFPTTEQKAIVQHIETEITKIEKTITTIKKEITLVEEYKTALIAEAVTGKIDVRDFEIPQTQTPLAMVAEATVSYNNEN